MTLLEYVVRFCVLYTVVTIAGALWPMARGAAAWIRWRRLRHAIRLEPTTAPHDRVVAPPLAFTASALEMNARCIAESRERELVPELGAELERAHELVSQAAHLVRGVALHEGELVDAPHAPQIFES